MWRLMQCGYFLCFSLLLLFHCLWYFLPFYCEISVKYSLLHSVCFLWRRLWNRINICATVSGQQCFWNPVFVNLFSVLATKKHLITLNYILYFIICQTALLTLINFCFPGFTAWYIVSVVWKHCSSLNVLWISTHVKFLYFKQIYFI